MEVPVIQSRTHMSNRILVLKTNYSDIISKRKPMSSQNHTINLVKANYSAFYTPSPPSPIDYNSTWSITDFAYNNLTINTNISDYDFNFQMENATVSSESTSWSQCKEWNPAQHPLFQTANFFFAAAFLIPGSFKQSVLIVRGLLSIGYCFLTIWGGVQMCAYDIFLWNCVIVILNMIHTGLLAWRFRPPTLSLELTDLYLKIFKPLRVSRKHYTELVKEAKVMTLERGDIYAVEDVSPADERLSILLEGKLRVTCDDTHLHFINMHQFVDSPEWESNHEQSDDVFQVTITAEEDSVYLCWPRMKLERVLRHRPMLKVVLDSIIGKDITQKLYALNEHLTGLSNERSRDRRDEMWAKAHRRSMSMDAVNTGKTGLVRSQAFRNNQRKGSYNSPDGKLQAQCWVPLVAKQFPATSPFNPASATSSLRIPEVHTLTKKSSIRRNAREVKFENSPKKILLTQDE